MTKNIIKSMRVYIIFILLCLSCTSSKKSSDVQNRCNENLKFKERFLYHIQNIDNNISVLQDSAFIKSVIFISNYAPVSTDEIMNYARSYPIGIFEQDHVRWIKWYEENKCTNIQFKDMYSVPKVYQDAYESEYIHISN